MTMLSTDFNEEIGALVRSLQRHVTSEPWFAGEPERGQYGVQQRTLVEIEKAIIELIALHIRIRRLADVDHAVDSVGSDVHRR